MTSPEHHPRERGGNQPAWHSTPPVTVIGGGLAGSEAALQLANRGHRVVLHEMRPSRTTAAHKSGDFAELVCSNTFKSTELGTAHGLLKQEMRELGSVIIAAADTARVPAGTALAVDRDVFSARVTSLIESHPNIVVQRGEVTSIGAPSIIATGPLTSDALAAAIAERVGAGALSFFDAIAPIVSFESLDTSVVFNASRYGRETMEGVEEGAYLNCPFTREEYEAFVDALAAGDQYPGHDFDTIPYFEGCMPVEEMVRRGRDTPRFGPMKPVGLVDPRTGRRPWAVVQLRREDRWGQLWNLVGFQTRLRIAEQHRVLRMIPGLADAEFLRYGSVHRNSYLNTPAALTPHLSLRDDATVLFAGQMTGVEGYTESAASGLLAGMNMSRLLNGESPVLPPPTSMLGALYRYLREADPRHFQPMNANFGLVDPLEDPPRDKRLKKEKLAGRAVAAIVSWRESLQRVAERA
ncbi:MAG: methylenetetrahydrofolate--tRNA-(uracil(54)-C(5))-methyltransferase (FADH(2)-oxidizing) TrmFO [Gemmatimonadota bacterium]